MLLHRVLSDAPILWSSWLVIPLVFEILPAIVGLFVLAVRRMRSCFTPPLKRYPDIAVVIPVFNSADTLEACIRSVYDSDYPSEKISLMVVDNGSIIECGSPQELMELKGKYYRLVQIQSMSDQVAQSKREENFD